MNFARQKHLNSGLQAFPTLFHFLLIPLWITLLLFSFFKLVWLSSINHCNFPLDYFLVGDYFVY